tara:strand:- start:3001 stop:3507 length:507 start_codon:yes stop_codon:yes gene_type:complete
LSNKDKVLVGKFATPVGLNGEIKVNIMTSTFEVFKKLKSYSNYDGSIIWNFKKISFKGSKCVVHIENCFSREDALEFKGQEIYSNKNNFPSIKNNEYYVEDLIGCKLILNDNKLTGKVTNVKNFGAGDLLEVKLNNQIILIPFNKENIISVFINKKEIIADPIKGILN